MNKQELIEKYRQIYEVSNNNDFGLDPFSRGEDAGSSRCSFEIVEDLKKLDEPQKVKVPAFVAEWVREHCYMGKYVCLERFMCQYNNVELPTDLYNYYDSDKDGARDKVISAILDGYEVEEEPKWVLKHQNGMYFTRFNEEMEPLLGGEKRAYRFTDESKAEALTIFFNGTVEKV